MTTHNVEVTDEQAEFIREIIATGEFQDVNDVVRAGLRLLELEKEAEEAKEARLIEELQKGFDAYDEGRTILLRTDEDFEIFRQQLLKRCMERLEKEANGSAGTAE